MSGPPRFELVPIDRLRAHEEVEVSDVHHLVGLLRDAGEVQEPLLVADGSYVILNGHHRYSALRILGARWAPAWVVDYDDPAIALSRWGPGPPISKADVIRHAEERRPYGVKTTRHTVTIELPYRPTPLRELGVAAAPASESSASASRPSR